MVKESSERNRHLNEGSVGDEFRRVCGPVSICPDVPGLFGKKHTSSILAEIDVDYFSVDVPIQILHVNM